MSVFAYNPSGVTALLTEARLYGISLTPSSARELLRVTGDHGIAIDAVLMTKRPPWLARIVGSAAEDGEDGRGTN